MLDDKKVKRRALTMDGADLISPEQSPQEYPVGDDLIWYETVQITRDLKHCAQRIERLGEHLKINLENNRTLLATYSDRLSELTAELAAIKGVTNA